MAEHRRFAFLRNGSAGRPERSAAALAARGGGDVSYRQLVARAHRPTSARVHDDRLNNPKVCICSCGWYVVSRDPDRLESYFDEHLEAAARQIENLANLLVLEPHDDREWADGEIAVR
jgi:hypothetical protein